MKDKILMTDALNTNWRKDLHTNDEVKIFGEQITILEIEYLLNEIVKITSINGKQFIVYLKEIE